MKKTTLLAACVLFIFIAFIQGLNCSKTVDSRIRTKGPGNRPVIEVESNQFNRSSKEETRKEDVLPGQASDKVLICKSKNAYAYHARVCQGLKKCKAGTGTLTLEEARKAGYRACKFCY